MSRTTLNASLRTETGKGSNRRLRAIGKIPGILYGHGIETATGVSLMPKEVAKILNGEFGRNTVLDLDIEGVDGTTMVIIRDYQVHPWRRTLIHVDFWAIAETTVLQLTVPFKREGRAAAERLGARIRLTKDRVKVKCLPKDVPASIIFNFDGLPDDTTVIKYSEIPMPDGVTPFFKKDYTLIQMKQAKAEVEETEDE